MFRSPHVQSDPVFAHSDWLQTLAEYGIAGVLLVIGFVAAHLRHGWRRWQRMVGRFSTSTIDPSERHALALQIGTISAIAACLVHALMDFNLHIPANLLSAAFLFGMLATRRTRADEAKATWPARMLHAVPAGLGVWMLIVSVPRIPGEAFAEVARKEFAAGMIAPAQKDAGEAISRGVQAPDLYFQLGEVQRTLSYSGRSKEAKQWALEDAHEAYGEALAIFPHDVGIVLYDAWTLGRLGRFEEAEVLLARAKELDPNSPKPWVFSALHWKLRNRRAEALADYRHAMALSPGWVPHLITGLHELFDPAELEKFLPGSEPAESK